MKQSSKTQELVFIGGGHSHAIALRQDIARMAGKALETAYRKRRKEKESDTHGELVGITVGDKFERTLPLELSRLSDPRQKLSFYRDYLEVS